MKRLSFALAAMSLIFAIPAAFSQINSEDIPLSRSRARIYSPSESENRDTPQDLAPGPHLFLDDHLVASSTALTRVVQMPVRDKAIPNPIVSGREDGCFQPYMTVLRDSETGLFRLWYGCRVEGSSDSASHIGYMESEDGIHWKRPHRILEDPAPIQFGVSIVDDGTACADPKQRYKYAWWKDGGLRIAVSADGFSFAPISAEPLIRHNHDITGLSWDGIRKQYVATLSVYRGSDAWQGNRRITMQSASTDLLHWTEPHYVLVPDAAVDDGELQFYAMDGYLQRGGLTIGMVKVLRDDLKADSPPDPPEAYGVGYTTLAWSRDGETWVRDTAPFLEPDPQRGAWDHAHAWIDEQVPVGDEVFLYYGGYARGHKVNRFEERQIGVLKIRKDRYVARVAAEIPGELTTPPLVLRGREVAVNADASSGSLRVEVRDESGKPIPGYSFEENAPIRSDVLSERLAWKAPLASLAGRIVRLAFRLEKASLFGFYLEE